MSETENIDDENASPYDMADDEIESLAPTLGGVVRKNGERVIVDAFRLCCGARRLLREKRQLVDDGKARPVYRLKAGSSAVNAGYQGVTWVAVRPCADRFGDKTYLGILVGDVALGVSVDLMSEERVAELPDDEKPAAGERVVEVAFAHYNPLILIPELGETVLGVGSWWSVIRDPKDLRRITDADIGSAWYVRMLEDLARIAAADGGA